MIVERIVGPQGTGSGGGKNMRMQLKVSIPVEKGNAAIKDGSLPKTIEETLAKLKAEAAYFTVQDGVRTGFIYFDMTNQSDMVAAGEPLFMGLDAEIDLTPAMTPDDLQAGFKKAFG
jgi:hypothetical protein